MCGVRDERTSNSLEKGLDTYGMAVGEVEAHEEVHGLGSGGVVARSIKDLRRTRDCA